MGPVSIDSHVFWTFQKSAEGSLARYLPCVGPEALRKTISECFGRNRIVVRQTIPQIRGGITWGSALFDLSVTISMFIFRSFLKVPPLRLSQTRESSAH